MSLSKLTFPFEGFFSILFSNDDYQSTYANDNLIYSPDESDILLDCCLTRDLINDINSAKSPIRRKTNQEAQISFNASTDSNDSELFQLNLQSIENDNCITQNIVPNQTIKANNPTQSKHVKSTNKGKKNKKKKPLKNEYCTEMFGRRGWICEKCFNFNYESRMKCNRCKIPKMAKLINPPVKETKPVEKVILTDQNDWICFHCSNVNYSFRQVCNMCHLNKTVVPKAIHH